VREKITKGKKFVCSKTKKVFVNHQHFSLAKLSSIYEILPKFIDFIPQISKFFIFPRFIFEEVSEIISVSKILKKGFLIRKFFCPAIENFFLQD